MKQARVRLVRQLKSEAEKQRQWKLAKEKELCKVKAQERRCQLEIVRRQQKFDKEYVVWKIKMDNAVAANKRLKVMCALFIFKIGREFCSYNKSLKCVGSLVAAEA